jgi:hypothetical protein
MISGGALVGIGAGMSHRMSTRGTSRYVLLAGLFIAAGASLAMRFRPTTLGDFIRVVLWTSLATLLIGSALLATLAARTVRTRRWVADEVARGDIVERCKAQPYLWSALRRERDLVPPEIWEAITFEKHPDRAQASRLRSE